MKKHASWLLLTLASICTSCQPRFPGLKYRRAFEQLAAHLEERARSEPRDSAAHARLSEAHAALWCFGFQTRDEAMPKARAAAATAVLLDPDSAATQTALGIVKLCDWDWDGARKALERAIALDPRSPRPRHWHALYLAAMGRHAQAFLESTHAETLAPESLGFKVGKGAVLYFGRRFAEQRDQMLMTIALNPEFPWAYDWLGMAYVQLGDFERALKAYERAVELSDWTAEVWAGLGHAYGVAGDHAAARKVLEELERRAKVWYVPHVQRAYVSFSIGDRDRGFKLLEEAFKTRAWELVFLREEPWFDEIRGDPRFVDLVKRMRLPPKRQ